MAQTASGGQYEVTDQVNQGGGSSSSTNYQVFDSVNYAPSGDLFGIDSNAREPHPDVTEPVTANPTPPATEPEAGAPVMTPPPAASPGFLEQIGTGIVDGVSLVIAPIEAFLASPAGEPTHTGVAIAVAAASATLVLLPAVTGLAVGAAAGAAAGSTAIGATASAAAGLSSTSSATLPAFSNFFNWFGGWIRRRRGYGRVYDAASRQGIAGATIRILAASVPGFSRGKLIESITTDRQGRFTFRGRPGAYRLQVVAADHVFPSQRASLGYTGGELVTNTDGTLTPDIPTDGQFAAAAVVTEQLQTLVAWINGIRIPLMLVGTMTGIYFYLDRGLGIDLGVLLVYLLLWSYELYSIWYGRRRGTIVAHGTPVWLATVRALDPSGQLLAARATDHAGHFSMLLPAGRYTVEVVKNGSPARRFPVRQASYGELTPRLELAGGR